jgi:hypothetical protein
MAFKVVRSTRRDKIGILETDGSGRSVSVLVPGNRCERDQRYPLTLDADYEAISVEYKTEDEALRAYETYLDELIDE